MVSFDLRIPMNFQQQRDAEYIFLEEKQISFTLVLQIPILVFLYSYQFRTYTILETTFAAVGIHYQSIFDQAIIKHIVIHPADRSKAPNFQSILCFFHQALLSVVPTLY
jgi:hypothetical protein